MSESNGTEPENVSLLEEMRTKGIEQEMPGTGRVVRLRSLEPAPLLRSGKMPDILTPLVIRSVYQEVSDEEIRAFLGQPRENITEALAFLETVDFVCQHAIMDDTPLDKLTLAEKRWIFRLVMGPAEILTTFRYDPNFDVADMDTSNEVQSVTG